MELNVISRIFVFIYILLILFFVFKGANKTKSMKEFAIGNGFSPLVLGLSLAASITSAATFIINPGFVAYYGWSAFLAMSITLPLALYISLVVMSRSFQKIGSNIQAVTLAQWIEKRYDSKSYGKFMGVMGLLLITFIVLICVGMVKVLSNALQTPELPTLIGLVVFVFGYTMIGGANTVVRTNAIQAIVMSVVALILLFSGWEYFNNGISGFMSQLETIDPKLTDNFNDNSPIFRDFFEVIFCNFIIGIAIVCQPHIITRSLMLKNPKDINKFLWVTIIFETLFFMVLFVGFYARLDMPDLIYNGKPIALDSIMSVYVTKNFTPWVGLLVVFGLLAAGLSSLEGLVQSVGATLTNDLVLNFYNKPITEKQKQLLNKVVISVLGLLTILISYQQLISPNLSVGILGQNGVYLYFSAAFIPVLFGIYLKNVPTIAPFMASITAVIVYLSVYYGQLSSYMQTPVKNPAISGALALVCSLIVGVVIYQIKKEKNIKSII